MEQRHHVDTAPVGSIRQALSFVSANRRVPTKHRPKLAREIGTRLRSILSLKTAKFASRLNSAAL
jgi:hypothetical protein